MERARSGREAPRSGGVDVGTIAGPAVDALGRVYTAASETKPIVRYVPLTNKALALASRRTAWARFSARAGLPKQQNPVTRGSLAV